MMAIRRVKEVRAGHLKGVLMLQVWHDVVWLC
jgi:hypothetical protein